MKIAFLYFDDIHHIYHSVSIAIELSRMLGKSHQIVLLSSTADNTRLLEKFCAGHQNHYCEVRQLKATLGYRLFYRFHRKFPRKSRMLKKHRKLLAGFDAIVGTELSSAKLRRYLGGKTPSLILTKHGAGDRSYGYRTDIKHYDFILVAGEKIKKRLEAQSILEVCDHAITGYAKFDLETSTFNSLAEIFPDTHERKTVIYNPHFTTHSSSWHAMGEKILDYFCTSEKYNLIFAPHIMLFDPRFKNRIQERWKNLPHIHIDTGSLACIDMSYTKLADIYIGDVSSQVYEFLIKPRYCIFLNAHKVDWRHDESFLNWTVGDVLDKEQDFIRELDRLLENSEQRQQLFEEKQKALIRYTFSMDETKSASRRSAEAIIDFLKHDPAALKRAGSSDG